MTELLVRTTRFDPLVVGLTVAVLLLSGFTASLIPARRAAAVDPATSVRQA